MAVSLKRSNPNDRNYFVRISIWGQWYDTELMDSGSAFKAQADAQKEYPGMSVVIYDISEKATPTNKLQTLGDMEAANPNAFRTEAT